MEVPTSLLVTSILLLAVSLLAKYIVARHKAKPFEPFLPVEEHNEHYMCQRHDWEKATFENGDVRLVCYECGLIQGNEFKLHPKLLKAMRDNRQKIADTREFKEKVIAELFDKHLHRIPSQAELENTIREAVERGMTLSRDLAVEKLKVLSKELKSGRQ